MKQEVINMTRQIFVNGKISLVAIVMAAVILALAAMVFSMYGSAPALAEDIKAEAEKKTIYVSGQAKVYASPDIAYITLGVITEDKDAKTAQQRNAASMEKVIGAIKSSGVKADDIKTVEYSIYPNYTYDKETGNRTLTGYTVNNSVMVTVRDVSKAGNIIDAASKSGVNTSSSISFALSDYEKYYNEALKNAVTAARKKANTIAQSLDVTLKGPVSVNEGGGYSPLRNYVTYADSVAEAETITPIMAGTLEITANVNIVYEYN